MTSTFLPKTVLIFIDSKYYYIMMDKIYKEQGITFNDLPEAMSVMLRKVENMEQAIVGLREDIKKTKVHQESEHIPMDVQEACEFLNLKKSTMYYYIQNGLIPTSKKGKKYTFFKDELIKWVESGRKNESTPSFEEMESILRKRSYRKRV